MCRGAPLSLLDIGIDSTDEEIFMSLENILCGSSLPDNVITNLDPYRYMPSNLPGGMWFLIYSVENQGTKFGFWKAKKVSSRVFPNSTFTGWKTTLVFYEGQTPYARKTDWIMQEYKVVKEGKCNHRIAIDANALCRVFPASERSPSPGKLQHGETLFPNGEYPCGRGSSSFQDGNAGSSAERERECLPKENQAEIDHYNWGDYIELQDLDIPLSPSESSGNSSCPILSTDEYFDPLALLHELEADISQDNFKDDESCVSRNVVIALPSSGDDITHESNTILADDFSVPLTSAWGNAALSNEVSESGNENQIAEENVVSTSKPHDSKHRVKTFHSFQ